jgi:hypothetical protein
MASMLATISRCSSRAVAGRHLEVDAGGEEPGLPASTSVRGGSLESAGDTASSESPKCPLGMHDRLLAPTGFGSVAGMSRSVSTSGRRVIPLVVGWERLPRSYSIHGDRSGEILTEPVPAVLLDTDDGACIFEELQGALEQIASVPRMRFFVSCTFRLDTSDARRSSVAIVAARSAENNAGRCYGVPIRLGGCPTHALCGRSLALSNLHVRGIRECRRKHYGYWSRQVV